MKCNINYNIMTVFYDDNNVGKFKSKERRCNTKIGGCSCSGKSKLW